VLGVGFEDPSQPPEIFGAWGGWGEFTEGQRMRFGFALTGTDGSTLLFSLNEQGTPTRSKARNSTTSPTMSPGSRPDI
jgi:hypothetical protein